MQTLFDKNELSSYFAATGSLTHVCGEYRVKGHSAKSCRPTFNPRVWGIQYSGTMTALHHDM